MAAAILRAAAERAAKESARRVLRVSVRVGELAGVQADLLTTAWGLVRERTVCADAELVVERVPLRWSCPACGEVFESGEALRCARCEEPARLEGGDELLLERILLEVD